MLAPSRRDSLARRYPARSFDNSNPPPRWYAGDVPAPDVTGWILSVVVVATGTDAFLEGALALRRPWRGDAARTLERLDLSHGGQVFIPWPTVELAMQDSNPSSSGSSSVMVSFDPVFRSDPPPAGTEATLYGRQILPASVTPAALDVPSGATDYRIEPAGPVAGNIEVEERGASDAGERTWARWTVSEPLVQTPGVHNGEAAWRPVPPTGANAGAKIGVTLSSGTGDVAVFWRYRLGAIR